MAVTDPSTFTVTPSLSKVSLSWTSAGASGYRIRRKTGSGAYVLIYDGALMEYDYKVTSVDTDGVTESTGVEDTAVMPSLTTANVQGVSVLDSQLKVSGTNTTVGNTYSLPTGTVTIDDHVETMHENQVGGAGQYDDRL
jgi:hypothetical protein